MLFIQLARALFGDRISPEAIAPWWPRTVEVEPGPPSREELAQLGAYYGGLEWRLDDKG